MTSNRFVEPMRFICSSECIRKYIKSEQNLMIGSLRYAEEMGVERLREKNDSS